MVNGNDEKCMREALDIAHVCIKDDEMPVGAIVVVNGSVTGKSGPSQFKSKYFGHGEMIALNEGIVGRVPRGADIVVYTTMEPCVMCMGAILHLPITRVVYALEDPHGGATARLDEWVPPRHQGRLPEIVGGFMREESRALMREWFETTKNPYWSSDVGKATSLYKLCMQ